MSRSCLSPQWQTRSIGITHADPDRNRIFADREGVTNSGYGLLQVLWLHLRQTSCDWNQAPAFGCNPQQALLHSPCTPAAWKEVGQLFLHPWIYILCLISVKQRTPKRGIHKEKGKGKCVLAITEQRYWDCYPGMQYLQQPGAPPTKWSTKTHTYSSRPALVCICHWQIIIYLCLWTPTQYGLKLISSAVYHSSWTPLLSPQHTTEAVLPVCESDLCNRILGSPVLRQLSNSYWNQKQKQQLELKLSSQKSAQCRNIAMTRAVSH